MSLPQPVSEALSPFYGASPRAVHRAKVELAKLVLAEAPPQAVRQLELAERFLSGEANDAELATEKTEVWTYIGSLACYCTVSDSASAQAVLSCLESEDRHHTIESLFEQIERVSRCRVDAARMMAALKRAGEHL